MTRVVYIAHPLGPDGPQREANRKNAAMWIGVLSRAFDIAPVADWIILSGEWPERPELRQRGLAIDLALVARCDEVWMIGGRVSEGMALEASRAARLSKPVFDLTKRIGWDAPTRGAIEYVASIVGLPLEVPT